MDKPEGLLIAEEVFHSFAVYVKKYLPDVDLEVIDWDNQDTQELFNGDVEKLGNVMVDLHLLYGLEYEIEAYSEFKEFPTINLAWNHVILKVLEAEGIDLETLERP